MINSSEATIASLSIHFVGNKSREESLHISTNSFHEFSEPIENSLLHFFLNPFKSVSEFFNFYHATDLKFNEVRSYAADFFEELLSFETISEKIATTLYDYSEHPNINSGELFVAHLKGITFNGTPVNALGLYKSELKDTFMKTGLADQQVDYQFDSGININKVDKGCLILQRADEEDFIVCVLDKSKDTKYWIDDFLKLTTCQDEFHFTKDYLDVARKFVTEKLPEVYEVSTTDRIDYLNKSINYFKEKDQFSENEFLQDVFQHEEVIDTFNQFKDAYAQEYGLNLPDDNFEISSQAVKKQSRIFKSVLKLDKNFHVYIHGDKDLIEQGVESDGRKFYKIYYREES